MYATRAEPCWAPSFTEQAPCPRTLARCQRSAAVWALLAEIAAPEPDAGGDAATDLPDELRHALDGWLAARSFCTGRQPS